MRRARVLAGTGMALALAFCGTGAWTYAQARGDDGLSYGRERDAALSDGRAALTTLTSLDASSTERARAGVRAWRDASTGPLSEELGRTEPKTGPSAKGVVTDAALTALDTRAGTAKLIATVRVEVTAGSTGKPGADRKRLEAVLDRTGDDEWKVKALSAVPLAGAAGEDGTR
ncbi:hypothetical protein [Streptomyces sp. NPDC003717]|uniref:hypothetical protein n=1 Tax=Streptomyces sp. NPDC003717 TaxID=3154276 RepID=UPI0033BA6D3A